MRGNDYEYEDSREAAELSFFKGSKMRGVGIYTHVDPGNRPPEIFSGTTTIYGGGAYPAYLQGRVIALQIQNLIFSS